MEDEVDWSSTKPLQHFLTHLALVAGDPREGKSKYEKIDSVNLMTMHAAKVRKKKQPQNFSTFFSSFFFSLDFPGNSHVFCELFLGFGVASGVCMWM